MRESSKNKPKQYISMALLAHVDAGKTTLSESLLYLSGAIRKAGRVDNQDAFLDTFELEKSRGITIFSKQAVFPLYGKEITLLDTPGHVDFSAEMERTLQVLDYAVLVISGADGVQGHTQTLWRLLKQYEIPTFLFVNKMDQPGTDADKLLDEIKRRLDDNCINFSKANRNQDFYENLAMCDEQVLEKYLEQIEPGEDEICDMIRKRKVFPCFFGSALRMEGVEDFMEQFAQYTETPDYPKEFGAKVYKIARDSQGNRLTYMKITGGELKVKDLISGTDKTAESDHAREQWSEKINQIRIYSGAQYSTTDVAEAGAICAVTGLTRTFPGEGLGVESESQIPLLEPVLTYRVELPGDCDVHRMLSNLRILEEEEPQLHVVWNEALQEIHVKLMGEVQTEVLASVIYERFHVPVRFGTGNIVYKETIRDTVEGVGHFEPLRHYAEVHLLLEPGELGSGMQFDVKCSEDDLDRNWQRLILTHLEERDHPGILTGSPITDMKITLIAGRAHLKHTEGGDFRQATYRAVRQGLMMADNVLLEPYYDFILEVPVEMVGRAMSDIQQKSGRFDPPQHEDENAILTGSAPVIEMRDYQREVLSYTKGKGRLSCTLRGYEPCHNQNEVLEKIKYDPGRDLENPTGSVFCSHGAGVVIPWDQVREHMHLDTGYGQEKPERQDPVYEAKPYEERQREYWASEKELDEIFRRTYGERKNHTENQPKKVRAASMDQSYAAKRPKPKKDEYLLVDGYNIIFAWEDLKKLAEDSIDGARDKLMDILSNYQGYKRCRLILVFDAYKVAGGKGSVQQYHNIHVVYTKEAETADQYIEKVTNELGRSQDVTVATSDGLEQIIIRGQGCKLLSAMDLQQEVQRAAEAVMNDFGEKREKAKNYLAEYLPGGMIEE